MNQRQRHTILCSVVVLITAALITAWYLLNDSDASTKAAQLGAMIALIAAAPAVSAARSCRRREPQDNQHAVALDAA